MRDQAWSHPGSGDRAATAVIVVHGLTGSPVSTRPTGEALAARGFAVEVLRLPGHGTSWRDLLPKRYADWRGAVDDAVSAAAARAKRVVLVGLSMGGTICLDVGSARQDTVAGVAAINAPYLDREGLLAKLAPIISRFIPVVPASAAGLVKNDAARAGVDEQAYAMLPTKAGQSFIVELPRIRTQLRGMKKPVLVAYSPKDHSVPAANSVALAKALGATAQVQLLPRSFHLATMDLDADQLHDRLAAFVDSLPGA